MRKFVSVGRYTVCAPSRTTFFTGRHSGQFAKHGLDGTSIAPAAATTSAQMLRDAGYATAAFGKTAPLDAPTAQGFDYFIGQLDQVSRVAAAIAPRAPRPVLTRRRRRVSVTTCTRGRSTT